MPGGELRFRAMGTDCHVLVGTPSGDEVVADELAQLAVERVELLEQSWSRFRVTSELTRLNASAGTGPQPVSADLLLLALRMREAWESSGGLFDPTVLTAMNALGYDADFDSVVARPAAALAPVLRAATPGMSGVVIDEPSATIALPAGIGLDPGAIGKGLAADIICDELRAAGASGVLVNLGGDLSVSGAAPGGEPWAIGIEDERRPADDPERFLRLLEFPTDAERFGVATSTTLKRRWAQGRRHHVIDPRTGTMSDGDLVQVTVVGGAAWEAEVQATTALLLPSDQALGWLRARDLTAILLTAEHTYSTDEESHDG